MDNDNDDNGTDVGLVVGLSVGGAALVGLGLLMWLKGREWFSTTQVQEKVGTLHF